jgi:spore protease
VIIITHSGEKCNSQGAKIQGFLKFILGILYKRVEYGMAINTDLAIERYNDAEKAGDTNGALCEKHYDGAARLSITQIDILTDGAAQKLGKAKGRYVTVESDEPFYEYSPFFGERCRAVCGAIESVCTHGNTLFVGLGNRFITPDSLGSLVADRIFATRHIKRLAKEIDSEFLTETAVASPGVMAQTGLESAEIAAAICSAVKPSQLIVCDALACCDPTHMGRTIQLCSTGISPGSGVENSRAELSERTLGIPVAAIGIPTVSRVLADKEPYPDLLVTPKPIDRLVRQGSELIAAAVNMYLHPSLSHEEILSLVT